MVLEYSSVVGTMVIDEVANINERMGRGIQEVQEMMASHNLDYASC